MSEELRAIVIVHFDEYGNQTYRVIGGETVRLFIVDERAPSDRVYEWLPRDEASVFRKLIPEGEEIGSHDDDRHAAIEGVVLAAMDGRHHLSIVKDTPNDR